MPLKLQKENHHWWPQVVSNFWKNDEGLVHRMTPDGHLIASNPKPFGVVKNDNAIRFADVPTDWDESFEPSFSRADGNFGSLIAWLQSLTSDIAPTPPDMSVGAFVKRLSPFTLSEKQHALLAECLASLIVRSPSFRNRVGKMTGYLRERIGFRDPTPERRLIGLNVRDGQRVVADAMAIGGIFAVLCSGEREFLFGDGFLHNVHSVPNPPMVPRCLVPLTPQIAVFYTYPAQYSSYPKAFVMNLVGDEVAFINKTVQIYAKDYLFFRNEQPSLEPEFVAHRHMDYEFDRTNWTDYLQAAMANGYFGPQQQFYADWELRGVQ